MTRAVFLLLLGACVPKAPPHGVSRADAVVYLATNVTDAQVFVDGHYIGPVSMLRGGIAVDPGKHRLELRHDDYFSRYAELDLKKAEHTKLQLDLAPVLP